MPEFLRLSIAEQRDILSDMRRDYASMQSAGMFETVVPSFEELTEELRALESSING